MGVLAENDDDDDDDEEDAFCASRCVNLFLSGPGKVPVSNSSSNSSARCTNKQFFINIAAEAAFVVRGSPCPGLRRCRDFHIKDYTGYRVAGGHVYWIGVQREHYQAYQMQHIHECSEHNATRCRGTSFQQKVHLQNRKVLEGPGISLGWISLVADGGTTKLHIFGSHSVRCSWVGRHEDRQWWILRATATSSWRGIEKNNNILTFYVPLLGARLRLPSTSTHLGWTGMVPGTETTRTTFAPRNLFFSGVRLNRKCYGGLTLFRTRFTCTTLTRNLPNLTRTNREQIFYNSCVKFPMLSFCCSTQMF